MALFADPAGDGAAILHLDWLEYAARLLGGGSVDWGDAATVAGLLGKAQGLLKSDLVLLPVDRLLTARLAADPALREAVSAKRRNVQPVRALLADEGVRQETVELVMQGRAHIRGGSLGVTLPGPAALIGQVATLAGLDAPEIDDDLIDDAAVLIADFLRILAGLPVELIVLDGVEPEQVALHAPVARLCEHYGWRLATRVDGRVQGYGSLLAGLETMVIAADANPEATLATVAARRAALG